jgi:DNA-binding transcriptional LysR family regulator
MEILVRVVETGSFSNAARHFGVGQPAVSKKIAQLEGRLGVKLLIRSTRGLRATEAGQHFYERAKRSIEEAHEAELAARGAGASLTGRLRISAEVTFARIHVIPLLPKFLALHQELEIDLLVDDRGIDLIQEGVDVALRIGTLAPSSLIARRIGRGRRHVIGTPAYFERVGTPRVPGDMIGHHTIIYLAEGGSWSFRQNDTEISVAAKSRLRVTAAEGVRAAVLADLGLAVASEWMFLPELETGAVRAVLEDWTLSSLDIWAVFPSGRAATAKARAFLSFLEQSIPKLGNG